MNVFFLGAGRPARGDKPAALKKVALNTPALDWQIRSFGFIEDKVQLHYLGGYHVDEVIRRYPQLNFTVVPDWEERSILHTLLQAPFSTAPALVTYSDTLFRKEIIEGVMQHSADVAFGVDSRWEERYEGRSSQDIDAAETIRLDEFDASQRGLVEFTGLVFFAPRVVKYLSTLNEAVVGPSLVHLLQHLRLQGFGVTPHDVVGQWAELNAPADIAQFIMGTKAETLARLQPFVRCSHIGKQVSCTIARWREAPEVILTSIAQTFRGAQLAVRSSAKSEDSWCSSNAGGFHSVLDVDGSSAAVVTRAIDQVIDSFGATSTGDDQILVQEYIRGVRFAGVIFTCGLETGAPYYVFNFDDETQLTHRVTAGTHGGLRTVILHRSRPELLETVEPALCPVLDAVGELEELLGFDALDIEFAVDQQGQVHLFQVRPITVDHSGYELDGDEFVANLRDSSERFESLQSPSPFVFGERCIFGNMPDWNPAEIIGTRPRPLALSLYRQLITNEVWARQRAEFGYRDVRPHPLIVAFAGQPYVDIRASLNSFIPAALSDQLVATLVRAYTRILLERPHLHDKIEFDVVFTVWSPTFSSEAAQRLLPYGVQQAEIDQLGTALKAITRNALGRLEKDTASIQLLSARRPRIESSLLSTADRVVALLDDCRRYGTLAFSHAARGGFVATTFLRSFVAAGILTDARRLEFMRSITTVASELREAKAAHARGCLSQDELVRRFGHLRAGTYEVTTQAYWENPGHYLLGDGLQSHEPAEPFSLTAAEEDAVRGVLSDLGAEQSPSEFCDYLRRATQLREATKFVFTRSLSKALDGCVALAGELSLTRDDIAYLEFRDLEQLRLDSVATETLKDRIARRKKQRVLTHLTQLPSLITDTSHFYCFERPSTEPNFVTASKVVARLQILEGDQRAELEGKIVLIPQADPGFDWLLAYRIGGLVTKYGGANSHMAIRAAEMGLPAAIGVGERLYQRIARMRKVELDCANRVIREVP